MSNIRGEPIPAKRCHVCRSWLPLVAYCRNASQEDGFNFVCRQCVAVSNRKRRLTLRLRTEATRARRTARAAQLRYSRLLSALPDAVLDALPADIRPRNDQLTKHRRFAET